MSSEHANAHGARWLVAAGWLDFAAAALHVACILGGAAWYRFVGAGEEIAVAVERGALWPHVMTLGIAAMLAVWGAYAWSGAGRIRRLVLLRPALVAITAIYLARAVIFVPLHLRNPQLTQPVMIWSSLIVLIFGLVHLIGLVMCWRALGQPKTVLSVS